MLNAFVMILPLVLTMALGWFLKFKKIVTDKGVEEMNSILYWIAVPAILFRSTSKVDLAMFENYNFMVTVYGTFLILPFLAWGLGILRKLPPERISVSILTSIRGNNVFMGLPAVTVAFGNPGIESLGIYLALSMAVYQFLAIALSQFALSGDFSLVSLRNTGKRLIQNPMLIACFLGLLCSLMGVAAALPHWFDLTLSMLGNIGSGVALMALGASLDLEELIPSCRLVWGELAVRLLLAPLLTLLGFRFFPVDPVLAQTSVLIAAMPAAINNFVLAKGMGMDHDYAGKVVVVSTVCSVVTLSVWLSILRALFS